MRYIFAALLVVCLCSCKELQDRQAINQANDPGRIGKAFADRMSCGLIHSDEVHMCVCRLCSNTAAIDVSCGFIVAHDSFCK